MSDELEAAHRFVADELPAGSDESDEKPPAYDSLRLAVHQLPQETNTTLISEAPPSYQQLFGKKCRRPHTRPRGAEQSRDASHGLASRLRERYPKLSKLLTHLTLVCVISSFIGLSVAMVVVGSLNVDRCVSVAVPVYLIVAGALMIAEVAFHGTIWMLMKRSNDNGSSFKMLRLCDCVTFILLLWLLIGSNWVFKLAIAHHSPCDNAPQPIDDVISLNTTVVTDASGGTRVVVFTDSHDPAPTTNDCADCSSGVYQFTVIVILFQYIIALFVVIGCCSKLFKK